MSRWFGPWLVSIHRAYIGVMHAHREGPTTVIHYVFRVKLWA